MKEYKNIYLSDLISEVEEGDHIKPLHVEESSGWSIPSLEAYMVVSMDYYGFVWFGISEDFWNEIKGDFLVKRRHEKGVRKMSEFKVGDVVYSTIDGDRDWETNPNNP